MQTNQFYSQPSHKYHLHWYNQMKSAPQKWNQLIKKRLSIIFCIHINYIFFKDAFKKIQVRAFEISCRR